MSMLFCTKTLNLNGHASCRLPSWHSAAIVQVAFRVIHLDTYYKKTGVKCTAVTTCTKQYHIAKPVWAARLLAEEEEEEEGFYKAHNDIHVATTYVSYLCRPMHPSDNHMALMLLSSTSQGQGCPAGAGKG